MTAETQLRALAGPTLSADVLDGQLPFERLEWLGDSVLDVLVVRHVIGAAPADLPVEDVWSRHSALVKDTAMLRAAQRLDLPRVRSAERPTRREDRDDEHRWGDSVEAWVGGAWCSQGWPAAAAATVLLLLPDLEPNALLGPIACPAADLEPESPELAAAAHRLGWEVQDRRWLSLLTSPVPMRRRLVPAGAALLELAVAHRLWVAHPDQDEGWLSQRRAQLTTGTAVEERAHVLGPGTPSFPTGDRMLLSLLGAALLDAGPAAALDVASALVAEPG